MPRRFRTDHTLDAHTAAMVSAALRAAGCEPGSDDAELVWSAAPPAFTVPGARVSCLPGFDALLQRRQLADRHGVALATLHICARDVRPLAYPTTHALPREEARLTVDAAYAPDDRWLRRPRAHGTNLRPERLEPNAPRTGDARWDAQRCIQDPHLVEGWKYTLRYAVLVHDIDPLTVDLWQEPRVMRAVAPFDAAASGTAFLDSGVTSEPVSARAVDWRAALRAEGLSPDAVTRAALETVAALVALVREDVLEAIHTLGRPARGGFELLEFDLLVDRTGQAHLLECARWPHVKPGRTPRTETVDDWTRDVMRAVLARLDGAPPVDGFVPLFPAVSVERLALLASPRPADVAAAAASNAGNDAVFIPQHVTHRFLDDAIVLLSELTGEVAVLNPTASYAWMRLADGATLGATIDEMTAIFQAERAVVARDVWSAVAGWVRGGLLSRLPATPIPPADVTPMRAWGWNPGEHVYQHLDWPVLVRCPGDDDAGWLSATLLPQVCNDAVEARSAIDVLRDGESYTLLIDGSRRVGPLTPRDTPGAVHTALRRLALAGRQGVLGLKTRLVYQAGATTRAVLLVQAGRVHDGGVPGVAEQVVLAGRPLSLRRERTVDTPIEIAAIVVLESTTGAPAWSSIRRADALQWLLADDANAITAFEADAVDALVAFLLGRPCLTLAAASAGHVVAAVEAWLDGQSENPAGRT